MGRIQNTVARLSTVGIPVGTRIPRDTTVTTWENRENVNLW